MMMIHEIEELDKAGLRKFGITTGIIAGILFGIVLPWLFSFDWPTWPWILMAILVVWGLVLPSSLRPVYRGWMTVGGVLGWINTRIILGLMFFVMFTPIALLFKIFGKDAMARKLGDQVDTYRVISQKQDNTQIERPY